MKSKFTTAERQFIQQCKFRLNEQEVPRAQWPRIIQQELYQFRKKQIRLKRKNSGLGQRWNKLKKRMQKFVLKMLMKKQGLGAMGEGDNILDSLMEQMEQMEPQDEFAFSPNISARTDSSYLILNQSEKVKKQEVVFDFDDEDEDDEEDK